MIKLAAFATAIVALSSAAYAADLPAAPVAAAPAAPATDFAGAYIGANIGYGPGTFTEQSGGPSDIISYSGLFVGGQVGYNFYVTDGVVAGIEGDLDWANETGSVAVTGGTDSYTQNWTGAVTGHLGLVAGSVMPYILGGVAFAGGTESFSGAGSGSATGTQVGWTAGLGVAAKLSDHLTGFVEGRYTNYGSANFSGTTSGAVPYSFASYNTDWSVRTGVNWQF